MLETVNKADISYVVWVVSLPETSSLDNNIRILKVYLLIFLLLILTAYQSVLDIFLCRRMELAFIVHYYIHFSIVFLEFSFCTRSFWIWTIFKLAHSSLGWHLGVIWKKEKTTLFRNSELEPHHQIQLTAILMTPHLRKEYCLPV